MGTLDVNGGTPSRDNSHDLRKILESVISTACIFFPDTGEMSYGLERDYIVGSGNLEEILKLLSADIQLLSELCNRAMKDVNISFVEMGSRLSSESRSSIHADFCHWSEVVGNRNCLLTHEANISFARSSSRLRKMRMDSRVKNIAELQILCESEALMFFLEDLINWRLVNELFSDEKLALSFKLKFSCDVVSATP